MDNIFNVIEQKDFVRAFLFKQFTSYCKYNDFV
jgi:hypothetical protein